MNRQTPDSSGGYLFQSENASPPARYQLEFPYARATKRKPWCAVSRLSPGEIVARLRSRIPPYWTHERRTAGADYPLYRVNAGDDRFQLCWGWRPSSGKFIVRSDQDARLNGRLTPTSSGTRIAFWVRSGPWGCLPTLLGVAATICCMVAGSDTTARAPGPLFWLVPLGWLGASLIRYPLSGGNRDAGRLIDAMLEVSEATVVEDDAACLVGDKASDT